MTKEQAIEKAAQLWCDPRVSNRVMDPEFCEVIAEALTATSVKVPELLSSDGFLFHGYTWDELLDAIYFAKRHGWAIKRMQEDKV